jgi:ABC-type multidrug transport system ATPase subunit
LCSHLLAEVESVCDDVVILSSGQVVASGTVADVIRRAQRDVIQRNGVRIHVPPTSVADAQRVLHGMPNVLTVTPTGGSTGWLEISLVTLADGTSWEDHRVTNRILEALIRADIPIISVNADGGRLQDVFLQLTDEAIA